MFLSAAIGLAAFSAFAWLPGAVAASRPRESGITGLFDEDNRLRFRISLENAQRANLRVSSSLLQLASAVQKDV